MLNLPVGVSLRKSLAPMTLTRPLAFKADVSAESGAFLIWFVAPSKSTVASVGSTCAVYVKLI